MRVHYIIEDFQERTGADDGAVLDLLCDYIDNQGDSEALRDFLADYDDPEQFMPTTDCKLCGKTHPAVDCHLHQGEYVGPCCWDERLRMTE
jgi:hypothetical protein